MPTTPKTSDSVRTRLRDAALSLFATQGFDRVSIRDIAERAQLNSATLYHYYDTKEHLYESILHDGLEEFDRVLIACNDPDVAPDQRILDICRAFLEHFRSSTEGGAFILRELIGIGSNKNAALVHKQDSRTRSYIRHAFLEAMEQGLFRPADSAMCAISVTAMLNSFARRWFNGATFSLADAMSQISDCYFTGLRAAPTSTRGSSPLMRGGEA